MLESDGRAMRKKEKTKWGDLEYVCSGEKLGQSAVFNKMSGEASLRR